MNWDSFLNYRLFKLGDFELITGNLLIGLLVLISTWLIIFLLRKAITRPRFIIDKIDEKRRTSIFLITKYIVWVITIVIFLEVIGVKITLLLVGSTALLVGIGLGLQNIFRDLVSGLFLLFEGSIKVGDVLEVDGVVGKVVDVNLRSTEVITRDNSMIIIPNSRFVVEKVINWSHNNDKVRFCVNVGIAYGSDVDLVIETLKEAMSEIKGIEISPAPFVMFQDFGDSSLQFDMIFWSKDPFKIEITKSELRILVYRKLKERNLAIPFPQRDVHIKDIEKFIGDKK
jgi:small-conductance mechanosensitive channel